MNRRTKLLSHAFVLFAALALATTAHAQADRTTGGIKGRVKVAEGSASGINVVVREGKGEQEREVARTSTDRKGNFELRGLKPGVYGLTFRKPGLQIGRLEEVEVQAGRVVSLKDKLYLPVDEGSIAFVRGSVFDAEGKSLAGARVELSRLEADGSAKKVDSRVTNQLGTFAFRLPPDPARYRLTVKADGMATATEDVEVDSAAVFRVALSLAPAPR